METPLLRSFFKTGRKETRTEGKYHKDPSWEGFILPKKIPSSEMVRLEQSGRCPTTEAEIVCGGQVLSGGRRRSWSQ